MVLYDVSSAAFEGRTCPLGAIGHPKDGVRGRLQIVYGLLTSKDGIPVAIEVFKGNTGDPTTVASQVDKLKDRFGLGKVVLVGDRACDRRPAAGGRRPRSPGLDTRCAPRRSRRWSGTGPPADPVDQADLAEITSPDFPGERLIACMNPFLEAERPASAKRCSRPPRPTWARSPRPARVPGGRCAATTPSPCALTGSCAAARSPSTSPSRSPTTASATPATRTPSPPKPSSTAST